MKNRRGFMKALGLGAVAAGPLAAAAIAAPVDDEPVSQALGFGTDEAARAKGRFYPIGVERPKFIEPPLMEIRGGLPKRAYLEDVDLGYLPFVVECGAWHGRHWKSYSESTGHLKIRDEGAKYLCDMMFTCKAPIQNWRVGFIDNAGFTAMCHTDTYGDINQAGNGWDEFVDYYLPPQSWYEKRLRPQWRPMTDDRAEIRIKQDGVIKGFFVCGGYDTFTLMPQGDHSPGNILWGMGLFDQGDLTVKEGQTLKVGQLL